MRSRNITCSDVLPQLTPPGFALYRALLRESPYISMTPKARAAWSPIRNPIKHLIRRAFKRNRADTSPRLVYPALSAGYRTLELLRSARASSYSRPNDAHASILRFLRDRQRERQRSLFAQATHPAFSRNPAKPTSAPREGAQPLLVRVSPAPSTNAEAEAPIYIDPTEPQAPPRYTTPYRPRPLSELGGSGRRKVPHMDMGGEYPFLRLKKPQPEFLSRMLTQKQRVRVRRTEALNEIEAALDDADAEDEWERVVEDLLHQHGQQEQQQEERIPATGRGGWSDLAREARVTTGSGRKIRVVPGTETYTGSFWRHGHMHIQAQLGRERDDLIARAAAMRELVLQERRLAEQEREERKAERRRRWEERMRAEGRAAEFGIAEVVAC